MDDRIDGVVITFADITVAKTLEAKLRGPARQPGKGFRGTTRAAAQGQGDGENCRTQRNQAWCQKNGGTR